ncbi:hypothetical protein MSP8887_01108 [Marinomonas spartinae]|uniref:HTH cro/C1-type domain-containing protein n=1 Tax=Marinomonas spartinae TaxID=1792290 RepID=A0A1A8TR53_9GAMM|nr:helix-turn-helix transcriptional regulator [Marinomonas spartinae]SBS29570.1 hypothetical protein MSP8887_01108 [Marinomonas spartinae]SBS36943.1 hypothetical protein MSP8886_03911 [Marinomonas spartinae]
MTTALLDSHQQHRTKNVGFIAQDNRKELGLYLRRRRESLDPSRLGILHSGRRRTPGLRREEVAMLADVSTTWYTWLEQGREVNASVATLSAIAKALQCSEVETAHVFTLSGLSRPAEYQRQCQKLSSVNQMILDQLNPMPAIVQNARFDILGFNQAYRELMGVDLASLPDEHRNCMYLAFTNDEWLIRMDNKEVILSRIAGSFRAAMANYMDDPSWQARLSMMQAASAEFNRYWEQYEILDVENHVKKFLIPDLGKMAFHQVNWWSAPKNGERLMVYVPDDEDTKAKLERLVIG